MCFEAHQTMCSRKPRCCFQRDCEECVQEDSEARTPYVNRYHWDMVHLPVRRVRGSEQGGRVVAQLHRAEYHAVHRRGDQIAGPQHDHNLDTFLECLRQQSVDTASSLKRSISRLRHALRNRLRETTISDDGRDGPIRVLLHQQ